MLTLISTYKFIIDMKRKALLLIAIILFPLVESLKAQSLHPDAFVIGSQKDIDYLSNGYLSPFGRSLATGINNGWYQTAKPHKLGRFDITVTVSFIHVPSKDQTFLIENSKLDLLHLANNNISQVEAPTAFGSNKHGLILKAKEALFPSQFTAPEGLGFSSLQLPMLGASIGLVKNTDLHLRYLAAMKMPQVDDSKIIIWGLGIKHDVLQWIPLAKSFPLDLSLFFAYSDLSYKQTLGEKSQKIDINVNGYTFRVLLSKKVLFITFYSGVGFNGGSSRIKVLGNYSYDSNIPDVEEITYKDPIDVTVDDVGGFVGNIGIRFKFLWILTLSADYNFGVYNATAIGLGINIDF